MNHGRLGIEGMHFSLEEGWLPARIQQLKDGLTIEVQDATGALRMLIKTTPLAGGSLDTAKALGALRKRLGKGAEINLKPNLHGLRKRLKHLPSLSVFSFREKGGAAGCGILAERSKRKEALLCVGFQHEAADLKVASGVLASFSEDAYEDEQVWALMGLGLPLPAAFHLGSFVYDKRGYMRLVLKDACSELALERFSGAEMLISQHGNLTRLWLETAKKDIARFELAKEREISTPHNGIFYRRDALSSALRRFKAALRARLRTGRPYFMAGYMWHCPQSNRIVSLKVTAWRAQDAMRVEKFAGKVLCCTVSEQSL